MGNRGLGGSGRDGNGRGAEDLDELICGDPPDPVTFEKTLKCPAMDPSGLCGRRNLGPEVEEPGTDDTWYKISRCIAAPCRDGQPPGWRYTTIKVSDVPGRCRSEARRFGVSHIWEPWCAEIERKYQHYETYGRQP